MDCPYCQHSKTEVYNSRRSSGRQQIWRRRRCLSCKRAFTTYESVDLGFIMISKRGGALEPYMRAKLMLSIYKACSNLDDQAETVDALTNTVETKLLSENITEIPSQTVAAIALSTLQHFHAAAYLRYLSYQEDLSSNARINALLQK